MSRRSNLFIFLIYTLVITILVTLAYFIFVQLAKPASNRSEVIVITSGKTITDAIISGNPVVSFKIWDTNILPIDSFEQSYTDKLVKKLSRILALLLVIITLCTWLLWRILHRRNEQQLIAISKGLDVIDESVRLFNLHPLIKKSFLQLKEKFNNHILDYQKLSSFIAHEQKNVLAFLRSKLQVSGNEQLALEVDKVSESIDNILTLTATKDMIHDEMVDVALVCASVCDEFRKSFPRIHFEFDEDANSHIMAREIWVHCAVTNLVHNAIKYGNNSDIIVDVKSQRNTVAITVSDQGPGIPLSEQEHLFDSGYRISKLNKNGYGIGLNLVRHVIELCSGSIWLESSETTGTTFRLLFPAYSE